MILGWPKSSFGFLCNTLWKKPNDIFGQPNTLENIDIAKIKQYWKNRGTSPSISVIYAFIYICYQFC